jgi:uncharacterized protein (TIGR03086 family)
MTTRPQSAVVTLPSDTEILIKRSFEAPRSLVWDTLTTPRHLLRWWGPSWCPLVACEVDFRPGGNWRYQSVSADGAEFAWHGTYSEIDADERIVTTEVFEGFPDAVSLNTMTLSETGGVTTLQTLVKHNSKENRDGHVQSGMEVGMQETMDRLDTLLANAATAVERFRRIAGTFGDVVSAVPANGWDRPAPCEGWVARDVVDHLVTWVPSVIGQSGYPIAIAASAADDPVSAWDSLSAGLLALLEDPVIAVTSFDVGPPGTMTVETAIDRLVTGDLLVHTWDLARATGQSVRLDPVVSLEMVEGMQAIDELLRTSGHYGPKVEAPADADAATRLIAFTGRDPNWKPRS